MRTDTAARAARAGRTPGAAREGEVQPGRGRQAPASPTAGLTPPNSRAVCGTTTTRPGRPCARRPGTGSGVRRPRSRTRNRCAGRSGPGWLLHPASRFRDRGSRTARGEAAAPRAPAIAEGAGGRGRTDRPPGSRPAPGHPPLCDAISPTRGSVARPGAPPKGSTHRRFHTTVRRRGEQPRRRPRSPAGTGPRPDSAQRRARGTP